MLAEISVLPLSSNRRPHRGRSAALNEVADVAVTASGFAVLRLPVSVLPDVRVLAAGLLTVTVELSVLALVSVAAAGFATVIVALSVVAESASPSMLMAGVSGCGGLSAVL